MGSIVATGGRDTLQQAGDIFRRSGVLLYPTSTLYGLGGNPLDSAVSARIHAIKGTTRSKPHLILTDEWERSHDWVTGVSGLHLRLMQAAESNDITILFRASRNAPRHLVGPAGQIAIRKTRHLFCRALIDSVDSVVTSTSANRTDVAPPATFDDIDPDILAEADIAVKGGDCSGVPSTMASVEDEQVVILRAGGTSREDLMTILELTKA